MLDLLNCTTVRNDWLNTLLCCYDSLSTADTCKDFFLWSDRLFFSPSLCEWCGLKSTCVTAVGRYLQKVTWGFYFIPQFSLTRATVCLHFLFQIDAIMEVYWVMYFLNKEILVVKLLPGDRQLSESVLPVLLYLLFFYLKKTTPLFLEKIITLSASYLHNFL